MSVEHKVKDSNVLDKRYINVNKKVTYIQYIHVYVYIYIYSIYPISPSWSSEMQYR